MTREPIVNVPTIVLGLIAVMVGIEFVVDRLDSDTVTEIVLAYGFVPADLADRFSGDVLRHVADLASSVSGDPVLSDRAEIALYLRAHPSLVPLSLVSYAFIHGGWMHVFVNSAWLLAFGSLVARRLGAIRFLILFIVSAIGGALVHFIVYPDDVMPVIGASGAISGVMAAAIRFMFQPGEALSGFSLNRSGHFSAPALPLKRVLSDRRVLRFVLLWMGVNIVTGLLSGPLGLTDGTIAWEAHIGGFLTGLLFFSLIDPVMSVSDEEE